MRLAWSRPGSSDGLILFGGLLLDLWRPSSRTANWPTLPTRGNATGRAKTSKLIAGKRPRLEPVLDIGAEARSNDYRVATVFLPTALVVGGIAALLRAKPAQIMALTTSGLSLLIGEGVLVLAADEGAAREQAAVEFFRDEDDEELTESEAFELADSLVPES